MLQSDQIEDTTKVCRQDPEEMLQNARERKEKETGVLNKFKEFIFAVSYLDRENELAAQRILGELNLKVMYCERAEQRWLKEIELKYL